MRWTQTLIPTQKPPGSDAGAVQMMICAGLIRQRAAGLYDLLPTGARALRNCERIARVALSDAGASEICLPSIRAAEAMEAGHIRLRDRDARQLVLALTDEEAIVEMLAATVRSYRQLPLTLFTIHERFEDVERPRFGLLDIKQSRVVEAYAVSAAAEEPARLRDCCEAVLRASAIEFIAAADTNDGLSYMVPTASGPDSFLQSERGNYAATIEAAAIGDRPVAIDAPPVAPLEEVHTPGMPTIEAVAGFLKVLPRQMLKTMVYEKTGAAGWVVAVVRGDHQVNENKLRKLLGPGLQLADEERAARAGFSIGFVGPHFARPDVFLLIDPDAAQPGPWVVGANRPDHHARNFNWKRDVLDLLSEEQRASIIRITDIRHAIDGDPSPLNDGGALRKRQGVRVADISPIGAGLSERRNARVIDESGHQHLIHLARARIELSRLLQAVVESHRDEKGIIFPASVAPWLVVLTPIRYEGDARSVADRLHGELKTFGIDALLDDRDARPGAKFAEADLIGAPVRITLGERTLKDAKVEVKVRRSGETHLLPIDSATAQVRAMLADL